MQVSKISKTPSFEAVYRDKKKYFTAEQKILTKNIKTNIEANFPEQDFFIERGFDRGSVILSKLEERKGKNHHSETHKKIYIGTYNSEAPFCLKDITRKHKSISRYVPFFAVGLALITAPFIRQCRDNMAENQGILKSISYFIDNDSLSLEKNHTLKIFDTDE